MVGCNELRRRCFNEAVSCSLLMDLEESEHYVLGFWSEGGLTSRLVYVFTLPVNLGSVCLYFCLSSLVLSQFSQSKYALRFTKTISLNLKAKIVTLAMHACYRTCQKPKISIRSENRNSSEWVSPHSLTSQTRRNTN